MAQTFATLRRLVRWKLFVNIDSISLGTCILMLAAAIHLFALRIAPSHYSIYAFLPLFQFLSFLLLADSLEKSVGTSFPTLVAISLAVLMALPTPIQALITLPYYFVSGKTYKEARTEFSHLTDSNQCSALYTSGLYALDEKHVGSIYKVDQDGLATSRRVQSEDQKTPKNSCRLVFLQEANFTTPAPTGAQLLFDFSDTSSYFRSFRKLRLINSHKGYSLKAYKQAVPSEE